jgi:hypothetical protein
MSAGEIDDHGTRGRLDGRGLFVTEAEKDQIRAPCERRCVRNEVWDALSAVAVQSRVESSGVPTRE